MHLVQLPAAGCGGTLPHGIHLGRKIGDHPFRHIEVAQHIGLEQPDNLPGILPFLAVRNKPPAPERKKREKEEKVKGPGLFGKLKEMVKKAENLLDDENDNF